MAARNRDKNDDDDDTDGGVDLSAETLLIVFIASP